MVQFSWFLPTPLFGCFFWMFAFDWEIGIWILKDIRIRISWISFLPFDWETRKRICKTTLLNSGLLFVLKNSFSNPFSDFRKKKKKKRKESKSNRRYLSFETSFRIFRWIAKSEIRILKSKSRFPNHRTHPIYSCLVFWNSRHWG